MAYTSGVTYSTGQLVSAAIWNGYLGSSGSVDLTSTAIVTTAGDLTYATGSKVLARLGIGAAGSVLSSTGSAPQWGKTVTNSISAAGTVQGDATSLTTNLNRVTVVGTSGHGVKLPTASAGLDITIINDDLTGSNTLKVWPNSSDAIDGGSANAADANQIAPQSSRRYISVDATNWYTATVISGVSSVSGSTGVVTDGDIDHDSLANFAANEHFTIATLLATDQTWSGSQRGTPSSVTDGTLDLNTANNFIYTPGANDQLEFTNETTGQSGFIKLINTTPRTLTLGSEVKSPGGTGATDLSVVGTYLISYFCDGTNVWINYGAASS